MLLTRYGHPQAEYRMLRCNMVQYYREAETLYRQAYEELVSNTACVETGNKRYGRDIIN
jgi:hypothetical protein